MMKKIATLLLFLIPSTLSSFTANTEDSPKQNEAFDYIKDRQSKVVHFNTLDPKADQYPELNPYLYCAGNPIKYIDPTGKEVLNEMDDMADPVLYEAANEYAKKYDDKETIIIFAHGNSEGMTICNSTEISSPEQLENYLEQYSELWQSKDNNHKPNILLMSCNTGSGDNSFAQKCGIYFGDKYNINIVAPTGEIMVHILDCQVKGVMKSDIKLNSHCFTKEYYYDKWKSCNKDGATTSYECSGTIITVEDMKRFLDLFK